MKKGDNINAWLYYLSGVDFYRLRAANAAFVCNAGGLRYPAAGCGSAEC